MKMDIYTAVKRIIIHHSLFYLFIIIIFSSVHTHTHTHTHNDDEKESAKKIYMILCVEKTVIYASKHGE